MRIRFPQNYFDAVGGWNFGSVLIPMNYWSCLEVQK